MVAGLEHSKRSYTMSQIGSFTRSNDGVYTGAIKTLAIDAKARLVPSDPASTSDKSPDCRFPPRFDPGFPLRTDPG
jgi:uncharacterized protein (DUF736 family)